MIPVHLDEWEWWLIETLAGARHGVAKQEGYFREPGNRGDFLEMDTLGLAGEIAFYKLLDRFPVISQDKREAGTPDVIISGKTVDVKSTSNPSSGVKVNIYAKKRYDIYVLMIVARPQVFYAGYIHGQDLIVNERIFVPEPKGGKERSPFYSARQKELRTDRFWVEGSNEIHESPG